MAKPRRLIYPIGEWHACYAGIVGDIDRLPPVDVLAHNTCRDGPAGCHTRRQDDVPVGGLAGPGPARLTVRQRDGQPRR